MTALIPLTFEGSEVRVVELDGEPWFVGKDVAGRLGYADPTNAMKQHCKGVVKHHPLSTAGGVQEARILSEPDVLRLIVGSKLPAAERFERWVFEEVLPAIRKTGRYGKLPDFTGVLSDLSATRKLLLTNLKGVLALEAKVLSIYSKPQAFVQENEYEANKNKILNLIKKSGSKGVTLSDIICGTKIPKRAREDILHDLIDGQIIQEQIIPTTRKPVRLYKMAHYSLTRRLSRPENSLAI